MVSSGKLGAKGKAASLRPKRRNKTPRLDRQDWIEMARQVLIKRGVDRVKVEPMAHLLGVTTGSFYHHFKNRQELLEQLLDHWEAHNSGPMFQAIAEAGPDPNHQIDRLFNVWISEDEYNPAYDSAVRAWAHTSKAAERAVRRVDAKRVTLLASVFERFGYDRERAFIRARITYFHQVGYQAMEITESSERRRELLGLYREALVGVPPSR